MVTYFGRQIGLVVDLFSHVSGRLVTYFGRQIGLVVDFISHVSGRRVIFWSCLSVVSVSIHWSCCEMSLITL